MEQRAKTTELQKSIVSIYQVNDRNQLSFIREDMDNFNLDQI